MKILKDNSMSIYMENDDVSNLGSNPMIILLRTYCSKNGGCKKYCLNISPFGDPLTRSHVDAFFGSHRNCFFILR